jgi:hypothetical protein
VKVALPVTLLAGAAHSTRVVGARWEPIRLPRTLSGPAPASTAVGEGDPACRARSRARDGAVETHVPVKVEGCETCGGSGCH